MPKAKAAEYLKKVRQDFEVISSALDADAAARTRVAVQATMAQSVVVAIADKRKAAE
jgi:hypothetical protein